ncbi:hypothetical protein PVK06_001413 [Gossypium arboreum]|uniref:DUF4216 domain-containing protein n=1 Tax=Gossypium arboreum TaxID=29729 RepID=A0ABR0R0Y4_GOSAR|nr:hypothetical protein PVK06_001413 [Gossypium arboreum]
MGVKERPMLLKNGLVEIFQIPYFAPKSPSSAVEDADRTTCSSPSAVLFAVLPSPSPSSAASNRKWKVVLFQCDWPDVNTGRGIKNDQFGFTMVNFSPLIHTREQLIDEPYVFSSQVKQVFYSKDPTDEGKMRGRRLRDLSIVQNTPNSEEANSEQQTVIGSLNVPETLDEPAEFQTESGGTRRGPGRTLLKDLYDLNPVEHVKVSRNSHSQPVGSEARLLAGYLDIIA